MIRMSRFCKALNISGNALPATVFRDLCRSLIVTAALQSQGHLSDVPCSPPHLHSGLRGYQWVNTVETQECGRFLQVVMLRNHKQRQDVVDIAIVT